MAFKWHVACVLLWLTGMTGLMGCGSCNSTAIEDCQDDAGDAAADNDKRCACYKGCACDSKLEDISGDFADDCSDATAGSAGATLCATKIEDFLEGTLACGSDSHCD
jgi:hypothetical protein